MHYRDEGILVFRKVLIIQVSGTSTSYWFAGTWPHLERSHGIVQRLCVRFFISGLDKFGGKKRNNQIQRFKTNLAEEVSAHGQTSEEVPLAGNKIGGFKKQTKQ